MTTDNIYEDKIKVEEKIKKELLSGLNTYRKTISYMAGDAPIEVLCLPKRVENALIKSGCLRIYDLFDRDLTKIKGIGKIRSRDLASSLDQFIPMSF